MAKFKIVLKSGMRGEYPYGVRDIGGFVLFFKKAEHYTGQDERFETESAEAWDIANKTLTALNL
jgi:hypothetical protein